MWIEKIVDHINYHILLYAVLHEEGFTGVSRNGNETVLEHNPHATDRTGSPVS
jgi:hypothetical protein